MRLLVVLCAALGLSGCARVSSSPVQFSPPPRVPAPAQTRPQVSLLAAHFARDDAPEFGGLDGIALVFSEEVDAASLRPDAFLVLLADGGRTLATDAVLAPASEADENRTVWILGDFGDPRRRAPTDVVVVAPVFTESGASLDGVLGPVSAFEEGGRIVHAEIAAAPCASGQSRVQTVWTDSLREVASEDLAAISLELISGRTVTPSAFEDHAEGGAFVGESRDDNVLDLCVPDEERVVGVRVTAGVFTDVPGHRTAATRAPVARARTAESGDG